MKSLKSKIFCSLVLFIVIPYLFLNMIFYTQTQTIIHEKIISATTVALKQTCLNIENMVLSVVTGSNIIAQTDFIAQSLHTPPVGQTQNTRLQIEVNTLFQSVQSSVLPPDSEIFMLSADGRAYSTALLDQTKIPQILSAPWYLESMERSFFYNWYQLRREDLGIISGKNAELVVMARAIRDRSGAPCGMVAVAVDKQAFYDILSALAESGQEHYFISEQNGRIVLSSGPALAENVFKPFLERILETGNGSFSFDDGVENQLVNYMSLEPLNWRIAVISPHRFVFAEIDRLRNQTILLNLLFLLPFSAIVIWLFHRFLRPVSDLIPLIHRVENGDFSRHAPVTTKDELGTLTQHFNTMLDKLGLLVEENQQKQMRLVEQEKEKETMRFLVLRSQINPHFLFNTLNNIKWLALINRDRVVADGISKLGHLLEASIRNSQDEITLREELSYLTDYAHIMQLSGPGKFRMEFDVLPQMLDCAILKLLLQPLVENCIIHGFQTMTKNGEIKIVARQKEDLLLIKVVDNGIGVQKSLVDDILSRKLPMNRLGVNNTNQRIRLYYGVDYGLTIEPGTVRGTCVEVTIPYRMKKEESTTDV